MLETQSAPGLEVRDGSPESICAAVAKVFKVRQTEVALLEVTGNLLRFLYPAELKKAGAIPLSSSSVAARTARTKHSDLFNTFMRVKHSSVFEVVKIGGAGSDAEVIQKLMSAPIISKADRVLGVIQVSRKAKHPSEVGPDFTSEDLRKLEAVAVEIAKVMAEPTR